MKRLSLIVIIAVIFLAFSAPFATAQKLDGKVGYLDLSFVFDEYLKTKQYDKVLEANHKEFETQRNTKIDKIREMQGKLALLKEEEKAKLEADLDKERAALLEFDRQKKTDLTRQRDEKIREILLEVEKEVNEFAKKNKYALVLNDRVLIYGQDAMNITEEVKKMLNAKYCKDNPKLEECKKK